MRVKNLWTKNGGSGPSKDTVVPHTFPLTWKRCEKDECFLCWLKCRIVLFCTITGSLICIILLSNSLFFEAFQYIRIMIKCIGSNTHYTLFKIQMARCPQDIHVLITKCCILASLHFNENVNRQTKISDDGEEYIKVTYPKFEQGDEVAPRLQYHQLRVCFQYNSCTIHLTNTVVGCVGYIPKCPVGHIILIPYQMTCTRLCLCLEGHTKITQDSIWSTT